MKMGLEDGLRGFRRMAYALSHVGLLLVLFALLPFQAMAATYAFQSTNYAWESANTNIVWDQTQTGFPRDDDKQVINMGFTFRFAGVNYTQVRVHANGALQFGADTQFHRQFNNTDLPVTTTPPACSGCSAGSQADRLMLLYWDDINPRLGGTVRYQTKGTAPNRRLVVSWENVPHFNFGGAYSFQAILYESGEFVFQYGTGNASGVSATIGVEVDNSDFTLYSLNSEYSYSGTAIRWFIPSGEPARLAEYRFEEGVLNGTVNEVIDWSGNAFHGQAVGSASSEADGYICRGVRIAANTNGTSNAVNTNLDIDAAIGNSGSITFWYRGNNAWSVRDHQLLDATTQNNRWFFLTKRANRTLRFVMSDSAGGLATVDTLPQTVNANAWKHIAVTWRFAPGTNQTVLRIYVDGVLARVAQTTTNGILPSNLGTLFVGDNRSSVIGQNGTLNSADGTFDSVRVYNFEISNAAVLADVVATHPCVVIDHIRINHDGAGLTCNPETLTLQACVDSLCTSLYTGGVSATLRLDEQAVGFASFSGGTGTVQFNKRTAGTFLLDVVEVKPVASNISRCQLGGASNSCSITFADSGFLLDVPNLLAARQADATIRAVRKDNASQACVPGFASGKRNVQFSSTYTDPDSGTEPVVVNGVSLVGGTAAVDLNFDANASAPLIVRYDDAGLVTLSARYIGNDDSDDDGLLMTGVDQFVSKPYGLLLETDAAGSCAANISCPVFPGGVRAGDPFSMRIKAVAWQSDTEPLTAADLSNNLVTPNYRQNNIALNSQVQAPAGGSNGVLGISSYAHLVGNETTVENQSISEVGVFRLTATPPANGYFGETVSGGSSGLVGRFIPAYLGAAGSASLTPSCGSAFSYQGQPMGFTSGNEPTLMVTGYNRSGNVTSNYDRGDFWRLAVPNAGAFISTTGVVGLDARLASQGTANLTQEGAGDGDGKQSFRWSNQQLLYKSAELPSSDDYPFTASVQQRFVAAALTDSDGVCIGAGGSCQDFSYDFTNSPGSEVRLGRLRLGNAHGSELQGLSLPVVLESWQANANGSFQPEGLDTCTTAVSLGAAQLDQFSGNLAAGETTASLAWPLNPTQRQVLMSAPGSGNDGSVQVSYPSAPSWLQYPWDGTTRSAARGLASFGIYKGSAPVIYRRELYR